MLDKIKTNIKSILFSKQFKRFAIIGLFSFAIFSFGIDMTFAADNTTDGYKSDPANLINDLVKFIGYLAGISGGLIGALTALVSILLDPSWINGSMFSISQYLKDVWIFISNVVYLIFAGILIAISFMNIIGKGTGDLFELKKALPKFIVGVLIVPFSWFIVQFVVSMASILAVSVYAWPIETFASRLTSMSNPTIDWCEERVMNLQGEIGASNISGSNSTSASENASAGKTSKGFFYCNVEKKPKSVLEILKSNGEYRIGGIIGIYTFGIMDVGNLDSLKKNNLTDIKSVFSLMAKTLFDIIFVILYLCILIALFIALFIRFIYLWIFIMISPIFGLMYFLGDGKLGDSAKKFTFKEFVALAMVPVYVAAALSFGLMFLLIIGEGGKKTNYQGWEVGAVADSAGADTPYNLGPMKLIVKGSVADNKDTKSFLSSIGGGALGALGYIMLKIFGIGFLWMAVMAALHKSTITGEIIKPIEAFGKQVGDFAKNSPQYLPIPGTNGLSFGGAMKLGNQAISEVGNSQSSKAQKWGQEHFSFMNQNKELTEQINKVKEEGIKTGYSNEKFKSALQTLVETTPNKDLLLKKDDMVSLFENAGLINGAKELKASKNDTDVGKALETANEESRKNPRGYKENSLLGSTRTGEGTRNITSKGTDATKPPVNQTNNTINNYIIPEGVKNDGKISNDEIAAIADGFVANVQSGEAPRTTKDKIEDRLNNLLMKGGYKNEEGKAIDESARKEIIKGVLDQLEKRNVEILKDGKKETLSFLEKPAETPKTSEKPKTTENTKTQ